MSKLDQKKFSDLLELITVLAFFFLIFVIYAPVSVWSEEQEFEKQSRFNMQNIYDVESFYEQLTGSYNSNFFEAMKVVNSARDSLLGDSLYVCLLYTSPSPRDGLLSRMPSSA